MTIFRKVFVLLVVIAISGLLLSGCGNKNETNTNVNINEPYKIGAIFDISGAGSSLGIPERDTAQMVIDEVNKTGGINGHPVELTMLDNKSDETEAALAAKKLIEKNVLAIVGCSQSGTTMAMLDAIQKAEIPLVSAAASIKIVEPVNDRKWVFKTAHSDSLVAGKIVSYLKSKNLTNVAFVSMNNAYGDSGAKEFTAAAATSGITILASEKFGPNDKDMTPQLTSIKKLNPQAVICWAIPPSASSLTANYRQLGLTMPLIHSHGVGNKTFIDLAGDSANGVIFPIGKLLVSEKLPDSDPQKQVLVDYTNAFEAKYGPRNTFGGYSWDALKIVLASIEKIGPDKAKIRDEIENTKNFVGISGVFNISPADHNGLSPESLVLVKIENGTWVLAD